jgi:hypothetical protein
VEVLLRNVLGEQSPPGGVEILDLDSDEPVDEPRLDGVVLVVVGEQAKVCHLAGQGTGVLGADRDDFYGAGLANRDAHNVASPL